MSKLERLAKLAKSGRIVAVRMSRGDVRGRIVDIDSECLTLAVEPEGKTVLVFDEDVTMFELEVEQAPAPLLPTPPIPAPSSPSPRPVVAEEPSVACEPSTPSVSRTAEAAAIALQGGPSRVEQDPADSRRAREWVARISSTFEERTAESSLPLVEPDLTFPEADMPLTRYRLAEIKEARAEWDRARNQYKVAFKLRDYSRLAQIIQNVLVPLGARHPQIHAIGLLIAAFHTKAGRHAEATATLVKVARSSGAAAHLQLLAASAIASGQTALACVALRRVLRDPTKLGDRKLWYVYLAQALRHGDHDGLRSLFDGYRLVQHEPLVENALAESFVFVLEKLCTPQDSATFAASHLGTTEAPGGRADTWLPFLARFPRGTSEAIQAATAALEPATAPAPPPPPGTREPTDSAQRVVIVPKGDRSAPPGSEAGRQLGTVTHFDAERKFGFVSVAADRSQRWFRSSDVSDRELSIKLAAGAGRGPLTVSFEAYEFDGKPRARLLRLADSPQITASPNQDGKAGPYARALLATSEDAERLFKQAIAAGDNTDGAIKALAMLINKQPERRREAIAFLEAHMPQVRDKKPALNLLATLSQQIGEHHAAIDVLWRVENLASAGERPGILKRITFSYYQLRAYEDAYKLVLQVLALSPVDSTATRWRSTLEQARSSGVYTEADALFNKYDLTQIAYGNISPTFEFALSRCDFAGVNDAVLAARSFTRETLKSVHKQIDDEQGRGRPRERARLLLTAARLMRELGMEDGESGGRDFRGTLFLYAGAMGDTAVAQDKHMDVVRAYYTEAFQLSQPFDKIVNRVVSFLRSFVVDREALLPRGGASPSLDDTIQLLGRHGLTNSFWDGLLDVTVANAATGHHILPRLYRDERLRDLSIRYLRHGSSRETIATEKDYIRAWDEARQQRDRQYQLWFEGLRGMSTSDLNAATCDAVARALGDHKESWLPSLDQQRMSKASDIMTTARRLFLQIDFEERERAFQGATAQLESLMRDVEENPTRFALGGLHPLLESARRQLRASFDTMLADTRPRLSITLPIERLSPTEDGLARVQFRIENARGSQPVSNVSLGLTADADLCRPARDSFDYNDVIRGGDSAVVECDIALTSEALAGTDFSVTVALSYRDRTSSVVDLEAESFSLRLYAHKESMRIENRFAPYADGGPVKDERMFFGRDSEIGNIVNALVMADAKCVLLFGQKRAGKSSVAHHLRRRLDATGRVFSVPFSLGRVIANFSLTSLLYNIARKLESALEEHSAHEPVPRLDAIDSTRFQTDPVTAFFELLEGFHSAAAALPSWRARRLVFIIDEFTYLYAAIKTRRVPEEFMKTWKAMIEEGLFSAVLVGQDVMPRFRLEFANEFGVTEDVPIGYLAQPDLERLMDEPILIADGASPRESRYKGKALQRAWQLTSGSPFYAMMLASRLVDYMNDKRAQYVTEADVDNVAREMVRGRRSLPEDKFDNLLTAGDHAVLRYSKEATLQVLLATARGSQTGLCSRDTLACANLSPEWESILDDLITRKVVDTPRHGYYCIRVGLFKNWLLANHGEGPDA